MQLFYKTRELFLVLNRHQSALYLFVLYSNGKKQYLMMETLTKFQRILVDFSFTGYIFLMSSDAN